MALMWGAHVFKWNASHFVGVQERGRVYRCTHPLKGTFLVRSAGRGEWDVKHPDSCEDSWVGADIRPIRPLWKRLAILWRVAFFNARVPV